MTIETTHSGVDPLCAALMDLGISGFEIEDAEDFKRFLEENKRFWDYIDADILSVNTDTVRVKIYLTDDEDGRAKIKRIEDGIKALKESFTEFDFGELSLSCGTVAEEDWAENWKQYFHPIKVGNRVLIEPTWESCDNPEGRAVFKIEPGMSFGTGSHDTTRLCIEAIDEHIKDNDNILDLGCGSGVLSIIALLLGAARATAIDIDSNAVRIARENAERNGISTEQYKAFCGDILTDEALQNKISESKYDIITANIVADIIIPLAEIAPRFLAEDGVFIASGIIDSKKDAVYAAIEKNFEIFKTEKSNEWVAFYAKHRINDRI